MAHGLKLEQGRTWMQRQDSAHLNNAPSTVECVLSTSSSSSSAAKPVKKASLLNWLCWAKFWSTYIGKDKTARVLHFATRGLSYALKGSEYGAILKTFSRQISIHRKTFRIMRWFDEFRKTRDAFRASPGRCIWFFDVSNRLLKAFHIMLDNVSWLTWSELIPTKTMMRVCGQDNKTSFASVKLYNGRLRLTSVSAPSSKTGRLIRRC
eukprot:SAG31_NODE_43_length_31224_cov_10.112578_5_plen_208_part_00